MKKIYISISKYLLTIIATTLVTSGIIYAANIISVTQTAVTGDKMTAQWVNEVNLKIRNLETQASGGNYGLLCAPSSGANPNDPNGNNYYVNLYGQPDLYYCGINILTSTTSSFPISVYQASACPGISGIDMNGNPVTTYPNPNSSCWIIKQ